MKKYAIIIMNLFNIIMNLNNCQFEMFGGLKILQKGNGVWREESKHGQAFLQLCEEGEGG